MYSVACCVQYAMYTYINWAIGLLIVKSCTEQNYLSFLHKNMKSASFKETVVYLKAGV